MNKKILKILIAIIIFIIATTAYQFISKPQTNEGLKEITIEVIDKRNNSTTVILEKTTYKTDALFLGELIDEINQKEILFELNGSKSDTFGRMIRAVGGIQENPSSNQYWIFESTNNQSCVSAGFCTGIDLLPIGDKDHFVFFISDAPSF